MDIRIKLTDENGETLDRFVVYQDGSDSEGAAIIRKLISETLVVEEPFETVGDVDRTPTMGIETDGYCHS